MSQAEKVAERCRRLIELADEVLASYQPPGSGIISSGWVDAENFTRWRSSGVAFLEDLLGAGHSYVVEFKAVTEHGPRSRGPTQQGRGVLVAVLDDIEAGYLASIRRVIRAEVFTNFLDMADHLHENGYHHAAASLAGAVLEDGLRQITDAAGVKVTRRDDLTALSSKLLQAGAIDPLRKKELQVWTDLRNAADHGEWEKVTDDRAADMIRGVTRFLAEELAKQ